jgi:iron complex outermembrane recepter protein
MPESTGRAGAAARACILTMAWQSVIISAGLMAAAPAMAIAGSANFHIAAQSLPMALKAFADQANMEILYRYGEVSQINGNAVVGKLDTHVALKELLRNTGLEAVYSSNDAATIRPIRAPAARSGAAPSARAEEGAEEGPKEGKSSSSPGFRLAAAAEQGTPSPAAAGTPEQQAALQEVVVTGTLIRNEAPVGASLITVDPQAIQQSGALTVEDVLATIPQLTNFEQSPRPAVAGAEADTYAPTVHDLPTLTLVNGHRLPPSGTISTQPDPDSIPALALERVELVPDGASSLYGSDAVGGVINFITRKSFNGVEAEVRRGIADGGYGAWDAGLMAGRSWDGGSAYIAYQYTDSSRLDGFQRPDYSVINLTPYGGPDNRSMACTLPNVQAGGVNYAYPALLPDTVNKCDKAQLADLLWAEQRHSIFASVRQRLSPDVELWSEVNLSDRHSSGRQEPFDLSVTIPDSNPYFTPIPGSTAASETVSFSAQDLFNKNFFTSTSENTVAQITLGADAQLPAGWFLESYVNYGHTRVRSPEADSLNNTALNTAAAGTTADTALDPFGPGTSPAVLQAIGDWQYITTTTQSLSQAVADANGPVLSLPGGEVKLAVGAEARRETFDGTFFDGPEGAPAANSVSPSRKVYSAYGELMVPIVGHANAVPLVKQLDVSVSGRFDHYSDFGSTSNPKLGLDWSPTQSVKLRGSWGTSFVAPQLSDLQAIDGKFVTLGYPLSSIFFGTDPLTAGPYNAYVVAGGNPHLQPETATTWSSGLEFTPMRDFSAGVTYYHANFNDVIAIPPLSNAIFSSPAYDSFIVRNPTAAQIAAYSAGLPTLLYEPLTAGIPTTLFDLRRQNLASQEVDGLDYDLTYGWPTGIGKFQLSESAEDVLRFVQEGAPGAPQISQLDLGIPRWRSRTSLGWALHNVSAAVMLNYNGAVQNQTILAAGQVVYQLPAVITTDIYFSYIFEGAGWLSGLKMTISAENLFNDGPPIGPAGPRTDVNVIGREVWLGLDEAL